MNEAVLFLFIKGNQVLLEYRLTATGKFEEVLVPGGGIDHRDRIDGKDHREVAMHREINEEYAKLVKAHTYTYIDYVDTIDKNLRFHIFFVHGWDGEHPAMMDHDGDKAKLVWMDIAEAKNVIQSEAGVFAIQKASTYLTKN